MDYYVGLDVSLRSVAVCVIDADGGTVFERSVACDIEDIAQCLAGFEASGLRIGFEAGAMSQLLFFGLKSAGFDVVCMEARQVNAALSAMRNKTDKTDARGIAQVLRSGWFNPVHMKSREAHAVRALLSSIVMHGTNVEHPVEPQFVLLELCHVAETEVDRIEALTRLYRSPPMHHRRILAALQDL